uniref:Uncharacterized protein n=1 Tax=Rhizophora mucronata TaxID=61149 RepID=A0A2P2N8D0_RHIMU
MNTFSVLIISDSLLVKPEFESEFFAQILFPMWLLIHIFGFFKYV